MAHRSPVIMDTLLGLHQAQDPQALLRYLLDQLEPQFGRAVACCYLFDRASGEFRLELFNDASGDVARRLWRADLRAPATLLPAEVNEALQPLLTSGVPVEITDGLPACLLELWGSETAEAIVRAVGAHFVATAPVRARGGAVGLLVLMVVHDWPVPVAAECVAHAAAALANIFERRDAEEQAERDDETGLLTRARVDPQIEREVQRADRYRRPLSVVVLDPPADAADGAHLAGLGAAVLRIMRTTDIATRYDAARVVVLLPETLAGGADAFLRRVRQQALGDARRFLGGAATFPQDGRTWDDLLKAACTRLKETDPPTVPGASIRGGLRSAMPTFHGGSAWRGG